MSTRAHPDARWRTPAALTQVTVVLAATLLFGGAARVTPRSATLEAPRPAEPPPAAQAAEVVDVTGDGRPDLVIRQTGRLYVYPHSGATNSNPWTVGRYDTGTFGWDVARILLMADVTGDQRPDLVAVRTDTPEPHSLWVYPHNGATGTAANWTTPYYTGIFGWSVADWMGLADVTGDSRPDIVARLGDGSLRVYPHNGKTGTNSTWGPQYSIGVNWNGATALLVGDVTGDGRADLVARDGGGTVTVYPAAAPTGPPPVPINAGTGWNLATAMLLVDVTGDGRPDVTVRDASGALWVYPHNGANTTNPWTLPRFDGGSGWNIATAMLM